MTIEEFAKRHGVTMAPPTPTTRPAIFDMPPGSRHYRCTLHCGRRRMSVPFSMGPALAAEPQLRDVLDCLASDAAGVEDIDSFEAWAADYGIDPDSRTGERTYQTVRRQASRLRALLGDEAFDQLLYHVGRL